MSNSNTFINWFSNKNTLFPGENARKKAFKAAQRYFDANPNATKIRRQDKRDRKNSLIKAQDGEIYMLAHDDNHNESYLGYGAFASVKKAINSHGQYVAVRIEYEKTNYEQNLNESNDPTISEEISLTVGKLKRESTSKKTLGNRVNPTAQSSNSEEGELKEKKCYQIQNLAGIDLNYFLQIKKDQLSQNERIRLGIRIINAVAKLHEKNIAHLDLKPANILIDPLTHEITLIDFDFSEKNINEKLSCCKGTSNYLPHKNNILKTEKKDIDIFALIKTLFLKKEVYIEQLTRVKKDDMGGIFVLPDDTDNTRHNLLTSLYRRAYTKVPPHPFAQPNSTSKKLTYYTPKKFPSCRALGLTLIQHFFPDPRNTSLLTSTPDEQAAYLNECDQKVTKNINDDFKKNLKKNVLLAIGRYNICNQLNYHNKSILSCLFKPIWKIKSENYNALLSQAQTPFQQLVITYTLLCAKKGTLLKSLVATHLNLQHCEAKYRINALLRDEIKTMLMHLDSTLSADRIEKKIDDTMIQLQDTVATPIIKQATKTVSCLTPWSSRLFVDALANLKTIQNGLTQTTGVSCKSYSVHVP
ncbi:MAG: hypothetical protein A3E82_00880 [Gammaproteobacteria bacterium RIFCSPHIGHO2_12_FULL_38_11]|nr:MAG: hypothetical protein A3E82_00880 [Gammaproteobacteria bacterium RIFCSPHIGHO2_12_FULL_38_11]